MKDAKRFVVKVGSTLVTNRGAGLDASAIARWAGQIARLRQAGKELVLVSSGAIARGMEVMGLAARKSYDEHRPVQLDEVAQAEPMLA